MNLNLLGFSRTIVFYAKRFSTQVYSPVQVKNSVSVYIDRDSDRDNVRDRDKNNRE